MCQMCQRDMECHLFFEHFNRRLPKLIHRLYISLIKKFINSYANDTLRSKIGFVVKNIKLVFRARVYPVGSPEGEILEIDILAMGEKNWANAPFLV